MLESPRTVRHIPEGTAALGRLHMLRGGAWFLQEPRSQCLLRFRFVHSFCWQSLEDYWLGISCSSIFHTCRELLCTCILQFFSSSDIPELWLLMCLGKHFSSGWSWFFCLYCPADAIFLFIFLGMVSYVQLKNNSSPLPPFLLYIQKTDISSKTTFLCAGITEQPLQMCLLFFLQALIPLLPSWTHQRAPGLQPRRLPSSGPLSPGSLPALAGRPWIPQNSVLPWQNGATASWCFSHWSPLLFKWGLRFCKDGHLVMRQKIPWLLRQKKQ